MDNLHLTYKEVTEVIPYRNLLIMSKDKVHAVTGEVLREVTEDEFFNGKMKFDE